MKTDHQAIDNLLRQHAARRAAAPPEPVTGAHLDADELSAFAENALPAPTRARYVAHLADCANCRAVAVNIARAGRITETLPQAPPPATVKSGWRQFWQSLFSIPTLQYALPVLAFLVIGGLVWRAYEPPSNRVSVTDESAQSTSKSTSETDSSAPATGAAGQEQAATAGLQTVKSSPPSREKTKPVADAPSAGESAAEPSAVTVNAPPAPQATLDGSRSSYAQQQQRAEDQRQQILQREEDEAKQSETTAELSTEREKITERAQDREDARQLPSSVTAPKGQPASESRREAAAPPAPERARQRANRQTANETGGAAAARDEVAAETRNVAGRSFRRQNNAWVDAAYQTSQAIVNIARGSEQYRALVADEPALRSVAEQLSGEVVVVWKNRVYRFR